MEINRNQYFLVGVIILILGIQFRVVDTFHLKPEVAQMVAESSSDGSPLAVVAGPKVVKTPDWLGWCLCSIGSVLILHSLAMKKPGG